eukprot:CAMPEP_0176371530 /NCGR_PEP_ID=MMETSP0126-20121128/24762_1 /TAXON_ID=141414 ORGANISM="Strombidinopsis acuminatum, Strain SPMC142" /NCGR_SAMPLE_ID=MMETSP0126 /ASSEMBLY_ACC=CAM_ASM_000229 /LENGTH=90 /DNA_ID=CAMNT_0017731023 /DNA_START=217 /DNA_END=489 /DNA_ORIENTATION=+
MLVYLNRQPKLKAKLHDEVEKITSKFKDSKDFIENYDMETADEFEYLRHCFYESMRIEPPVSISSSNCFNQDVTIDGVKIKSCDGFFINI